jgi:hypothetical protein
VLVIIKKAVEKNSDHFFILNLPSIGDIEEFKNIFQDTPVSNNFSIKFN